MKKYTSILSVLLFGIIVFWFFMQPKFDSKKASLAGEVISLTKMKTSGRYIIELSENGKTRHVHYTFLNNNFDVQIGDSLFKKSDADLFVKSKTDGIIRLANYQAILISK